MNPWLTLLTTVFILMLFHLSAHRDAGGDEFRGVLGLLRALSDFYCWFWHRLEYNKLAPLPERGAAILISNHTCNIDHMLLQASSTRLLGFMIAKEYYDDPRFHTFCRLAGCIPVRRDGKDLAATRAALRVLGEGRVLPIFPEGHIIPTSGREIAEGKPGAAFIATHAAVPVIPAYIEGTPATNILWKSFFTPSHARITYGDPIDLGTDLHQTPLDKERLAALTLRFMHEIATLREKSRANRE